LWGKIALAQPQAKVCVLLSVLWSAVVDVCGLVVQCAQAVWLLLFFLKGWGWDLGPICAILLFFGLF
jgi:hypothetical protein